MHVVGFITQASVIRKILDHAGHRIEPLVHSGRTSPASEIYQICANRIDMQVFSCI